MAPRPTGLPLLLNTKLIRFGPLFHENPVFSFIFASVKFLAQNYLFAPLFVLEKVGHFGGYPVELVFPSFF